MPVATSAEDSELIAFLKEPNWDLAAALLKRDQREPEYLLGQGEGILQLQQDAMKELGMPELPTLEDALPLVDYM